MSRVIEIIEAPSNLGLRPPEAGSVPGCYKLPWALREHGLLEALEATVVGAVVPPRYRSHWSPDDGDRNAEGIATFSIALADRLRPQLDTPVFNLVLGGDCSILIGPMLALKRLGRYGLVFLDAHNDFRHPGNAPAIGAAAGEDLAIVTGRGDHRLINLEGRGPYAQHEDIVLMGVRPSEPERDELFQAGSSLFTSAELDEQRAEHAGRQALARVTRSTAGFWVHLDCDVLDAAVMPAVDSPEPGGLSLATLSASLRPLVTSPHCVGLDLTIYDPDLDPKGVYAAALVRCLAAAFGHIGNGL